MEHDVFSCQCHETCSWCTEPVLDATLRETRDGARICRTCTNTDEGRRAFMSTRDIEASLMLDTERFFQ